MALSPMLVRVALGLGMDQKTDVKKVMPGKLVTSQNARYTKTGRLDPRPGFTNAQQWSAAGIDRLYANGNQTVALVKQASAPDKLQVLDPNLGGTAGLQNIGNMPTVPRAVVQRFGQGLSVDVQSVDVAINANYIALVSIKDAADSSHYSVLIVTIIDATTGKVVQTASQNSAVGTAYYGLRVVANPSAATFVVGVMSSPKGSVAFNGTLTLYEVGTTGPTFTSRFTAGSITGESVVQANGWPARSFDMASFSGCIIAIVRENLQARLYKVLVSGWTSSNSVQGTTGPVAISVPASLASSNIYVLIGGNAFRVPISTLSFTGSAYGNAAGTIYSMVGIEDPNDATFPLKTWMTGANAIGGDNQSGFLATFAYKSNGTFTQIEVHNNTQVVSKPIVTSSGQIFCWLNYYNSINAADTETFFALVAYGSPSPFAILLSSSAKSSAFFDASNLIQLPDGTFSCGAIEMQGNQSLYSAARSQRQVILNFSLSPYAGWRSARADDGALLFTGGYLTSFDGSQVCENGFIAYPFLPTLVQTTGGSKTLLGTYSVVLVWERIDALGRLHRSPASFPSTITLTGVNNAIKVEAQTLQFATAVADATQVSLVVYCTANGQQTYYREQAVQNDPTHNDQAVTLILADASITANEQLYIGDGTADDVVIDAPTSIALGSTRLYAVSGDRLSALQPAKEFVYGIAPGFYPDVLEPVHYGDEIAGVSWIAGRLFVYKDRSIFTTTGDGPDLTGANDTIGVFDQFSIDVGCTDPASLVTSTFGAVFRSHKGFYLLGRDGSLTYIGAGVEDFMSGQTVIDAAFCEDTREIRFLLSGGTAAAVLTLFETEQGIEWRWSTDTYSATPLSAIASVNGVHVGAWNNAGTQHLGLLTQLVSAGDFGTNGGIPNVYETGWIPIGELQNYGCLWSAFVLGELVNGATSVDMSIDLAYDFVNSYGETHTITNANATINGSQWQVEAQSVLQECQVVKVRMRPASWGLSLSEMLLELGMAGRVNLPAAKRV